MLLYVNDCTINIANKKNMKRILITVFFGLVCTLVQSQGSRAPAYPLVTHDPYFSIWSTTDQLAASLTKHWTGTDHSLIGLVKVDGTIYRFLGDKTNPYKIILPAADDVNYQAAYTETKPQDGWNAPSFNDSKWKKGIAPFGDTK